MKKIIFLSILYIIINNQALARESCYARAVFKDSYPLDSSQFAIEFNVSSSQCKKYACEGYIDYIIHYIADNGKKGVKSTLQPYRINVGESSTISMDSKTPGGLGENPIVVKDVEITSLTCFNYK